MSWNRTWKSRADFKPMAARTCRHCVIAFNNFAADGRYELFKTTKKYDGDVGREQHHYPTPQKLPA